jgi:uncharacterized coiled-coil protein SlyX
MTKLQKHKIKSLKFIVKAQGKQIKHLSKQLANCRERFSDFMEKSGGKKTKLNKPIKKSSQKHKSTRKKKRTR